MLFMIVPSFWGICLTSDSEPAAQACVDKRSSTSQSLLSFPHRSEEFWSGAFRKFQEEAFLFFVPEGRRILAGGETTGTECNRTPRPGRAQDRSSSLSPFQGWKSFWRRDPVVAPPANILSASGAEEYFDEFHTHFFG